MTDELTPIQVEQKLRSLVTELTRAQQALAQARDVEVGTKHAYESAHRRALLSDERPKVTRDGFTAAERDAWVQERCAKQQRDYDIAEAKRKAAEDHLRTLRDQAVIVATLAKSVHQAYSMAGATG